MKVFETTVGALAAIFIGGALLYAAGKQGAFGAAIQRGAKIITEGYGV